MGVVLLFEATTKPDSIDEFIRFADEILADTRSFVGCESIEMLQSTDHPEQFVMVERWTSRAHHDTYVKWRSERGDLKVLFSFFASREIRAFQQIDV